MACRYVFNTGRLENLSPTRLIVCGVCVCVGMCIALLFNTMRIQTKDFVFKIWITKLFIIVYIKIFQTRIFN